MFHFDRGLKLTTADLAIDVRRRQPRAFISHAHSDHMARHELALCTPQTACLYHHRLGKRPVLELRYRETIEFGPLRLTTYPAGHCMGSAMLLAEDGDQTLLYTGDFKLGESLTAEPAELPKADILVIECTYGRPAYRLTPREEAIEQLLAIVRDALAQERTPVINAYVMGKSQEVTRILTRAGIPVLQHPAIAAVSKVYTACGVDLGEYSVYPGHPMPGHAVVAPPRMHKGSALPGLGNAVTIAVSGWAMNGATRWRLGAQHAVPLSDHADYDQLFEAVARVGARAIYCTHGPAEFVDDLRAAGFPAFRLEDAGREDTERSVCVQRQFAFESS